MNYCCAVKVLKSYDVVLGGFVIFFCFVFALLKVKAGLKLPISSLCEKCSCAELFLLHRLC